MSVKNERIEKCYRKSACHCLQQNYNMKMDIPWGMCTHFVRICISKQIKFKQKMDKELNRKASYCLLSLHQEQSLNWELLVLVLTLCISNMVHSKLNNLRALKWL